MPPSPAKSSQNAAGRGTGEGTGTGVEVIEVRLGVIMSRWGAIAPRGGRLEKTGVTVLPPPVGRFGVRVVPFRVRFSLKVVIKGFQNASTGVMLVLDMSRSYMFVPSSVAMGGISLRQTSA
jgi:hypothetical protein